MATSVPPATLSSIIDPWTVEVITPSDSLIANFQKWDLSKSTTSRLRSFNRARKWISNLLRRDFKVPDAHKLRHSDIMNALDNMINATAMPGGISYEDYFRSYLAPLPIKTVVTSNNGPTTTEPEVYGVVTVPTGIIEVVSGVGTIAEDATNTSDNNEEENFQDAVNGEDNTHGTSKFSAETVNLETEPGENSSQVITEPGVCTTSQPKTENTAGALQPICKSIWL